jgi:hypothetical protein
MLQASFQCEGMNTMSTIFRGLAVLLAVAGSAATVAIFMRQRRAHRLMVEKGQLKSDMRDWEAEGGNLRPPPALPPAPPELPSSPK